MQINNRLSLGLVCLLFVFALAACGDSNRDDDGVAQIPEPEATAAPSERSAPVGTVAVAPELTDEEIATLFTECLRTNGMAVVDPILNADGSVNTLALRQSIGQNADGEAVATCLPLLQSATFSQRRLPEDPVELRDNVLEFAQWLRDKGYDVPDPDLSDNP